MMRRLSLVLSTALLLSACGASKEEVAAAVQAARDEETARYNAEMKKMQDAHTAESGERDKRIGSLEDEVTRLGGNLSQVKADLGSKQGELASTKASLEATARERDQLKKLREQAEREAAQYKEVSNKLKAMVDAGQLQVVMRKGRMTLKLPDAILFPSGSKTLKKEGKEALTSVAEVLKGVPDRDFVVAGHTDNVPVGKGGGFKSNWDLSTARAVEVVNLMIAAGVAPERLSAAGFGEFDPIGDNTTADGKKSNRRLEIILMPKIENLGFDGTASNQ